MFLGGKISGLYLSLMSVVKGFHERLFIPMRWERTIDFSWILLGRSVGQSLSGFKVKELFFSLKNLFIKAVFDGIEGSCSLWAWIKQRHFSSCFEQSSSLYNNVMSGKSWFLTRQDQHPDYLDISCSHSFFSEVLTPLKRWSFQWRDDPVPFFVFNPSP